MMDIMEVKKLQLQGTVAMKSILYYYSHVISSNSTDRLLYVKYFGFFFWIHIYSYSLNLKTMMCRKLLVAWQKHKTFVFNDSPSLKKIIRRSSKDYLYKFCIHFAVCLLQVDKQIGIYNDKYTMGIFDIELRGLWSLKRL